MEYKLGQCEVCGRLKALRDGVCSTCQNKMDKNKFKQSEEVEFMNKIFNNFKKGK